MGQDFERAASCVRATGSPFSAAAIAEGKTRTAPAVDAQVLYSTGAVEGERTSRENG